MNDVLDNPAWNALISGNENLSYGNEKVKYFAKEVSPFAALKEASAEGFQLLHKLVPAESISLIISPVEMDTPARWKILQCVKSFQFVYMGNDEPVQEQAELITLTDEHIDQMLHLTQLTNPGPFAPRTIDFGHYRGVMDGDKLVAMAGQRLNPLPYAEISAVCTHPDYTGKGYARQLLMFHVHRIKAAGQIPFLHVRCDNYRAIKVYEDLGFKKRTVLYYYVMQNS